MDESKPHKVKLAFCTSCDCVTEMSLTDDARQGLCLNCGTVQFYVQNPKILIEMRSLSIINEGLMARIQINQEKIEKLGHMLNPVEIVKQPKWRRVAESHECSKCGRKTRYIYGEIPRCYEECKPDVIRGKVGLDDIPEAIGDMIRDYLTGNDDENLGDLEFIKRV